MTNHEIVLKFKARLEKAELAIVQSMIKTFADGTQITESKEVTHIPIVEEGIYIIEIKMVKT